MSPNLRPHGLFRGEGGSNDSCGVVSPDGKLMTCFKNVEPGSTVFVRTSGGGSRRDPLERGVEKAE